MKIVLLDASLMNEKNWLGLETPWEMGINSDTPCQETDSNKWRPDAEGSSLKLNPGKSKNILVAIPLISLPPEIQMAPSFLIFRKI